MALTVAETLALGRGKAEFVYHPCGIPWCCYTSGLDWDSVTITHKMVMFGTQTYDGGASKFASLVDAYPYLERPGAVTINMLDGAAVLTGGDWSVQIQANPAPVVNNTLNSRSGIQGLEGLQAIASTAHDHGIAWGVLSESFGKGDTTLNVKNDVGDRLSDAVTAAAGDPYLIWIGAECMAATAVAADGDEWDFTVAAGHRGLFMSKTQSQYLDNLATQIYVADAPLNGLAGRPASLWMFIVSSTGAPIAGPVAVNDQWSKIEKVPQLGSDKKWTISHLPWWSWLDYEMELSDVAGRLDRYVFNRAPATTQHPPHMQIRESTDNGVNWSAWTDVWICAAGTTVTYDDWSEVKAAVKTAIDAVSPNSWTYQIGSRGPYREFAANHRMEMRGPLPAICKWGMGESWAYNWENCMEMVTRLKWATDPWENTWWNYYVRCAVDSYEAEETYPEYLYQMLRNDDTDYDDEASHTWRKKWPIPLTSGNPILYVKDEESIAALGAGDWIEVGSDEFVMEPYAENRTTLAETKIASITGKAITINVPTADEYMGYEALRGKKAEGDPDKKKFVEGMYLYYVPKTMDADPWPIHFSVDFASLKLSTLFKAIMGDTSEITVSERIQADHIPGGYDVGDHTETIDWDTLDLMADDLGYLGLEFAFRYSGKINLWKEYQNCLRFLGLTPTREWDAMDEKYKLRCRRVGVVNSSIAEMTGRVLNADNIKENCNPVTNVNLTPLYNTINLSMNWLGKQEKWEIDKKPIRGNTSRTTGGKSVEIDVGAKFIHVELNETTWEDLLLHFGNILDRTMTPQPTQTVTATVKDKFGHGVGVEVSTTLANVLHPFAGSPELDDYPCMVTSMTADLGKCECKYTYRVAPGIDSGWAPACIIPANNSVIVDADTIRVDDISDNSTGRNFSNVYPTLGWYDHWFFGPYIFNETMSEPQEIAGASDKKIMLVERGTTTPTVITGLEARLVDKRTYAEIIAAVAPFFYIEGAHVGYDVTKSWVVFFETRDTVGLTEEQEDWVYIADDTGELQDSAASHFTGNFWK